jgi:hypothetical protein
VETEVTRVESLRTVVRDELVEAIGETAAARVNLDALSHVRPPVYSAAGREANEDLRGMVIIRYPSEKGPWGDRRFIDTPAVRVVLAAKPPFRHRRSRL